MSNFIAIDLEASGVYAVGGPARGAAKPTHALAWTGDDGQSPAALTADTARALGDALKEKLKAAGFPAGAPALVCVGRDRVILKELKHPPVPPSEEPALIRFQAIKEMSESPDEVALDYVPLGNGEATGERRAMAVLIRKDVLTAIQAMCAAAGLKVAAITPRPYAAAAGLARAFANDPSLAPENKDDTVAALTLTPGGGEFTVVRGGEILLTSAIPAPVLASESMLIAQLKRTMAVFAGQHPGHPIAAVYLAEAGPGWGGRLAGALGVPVQTYDPLAGAVPKVPAYQRGRFAGAAGLLTAKAAEPLPINFAAPRQPRAGTDPNKRKLAFVGIAAGVLLFAGLAFGLYLKGESDAAVRELAAERDALKKKLDDGGDDTKRHDAVDGWTKRRVSYLDELFDLCDRLPADDSVRVKSFNGTPGQVVKDKQGEYKQVVQANVELKLESTGSVDSLVSAFERDNPRPEPGKSAPVNKFYTNTKTPEGGARTGATDGKHTQVFTVRTEFHYRDAATFVRQPAFTPPKRSWGQ